MHNIHLGDYTSLTYRQSDFPLRIDSSYPARSTLKMLKAVGLVLSFFFIIHSITSKSQMVTSDLPRGVHPELASFFTDSDTFQCLDGSKSLPFDHVNDDFCDCEDGSDEPGTSACSLGKFYCANQGHVAKILGSSRVNDGICDCCDGSDEWSATDGLRCADHCDELGKEARLKAAREAAVQEEGFVAKQSLIREGKEMRVQKQAEVEKLQRELELAQELQLDKEEVKLTAEEAEKEALDKHRAAQDQLREAKEAEERTEDERRSLAAFEELDSNGDGKVDGTEIAAAVTIFDQNKDGEVSQDEAKFYLVDKEEFIKEDFLTTGWPLIRHRFNGNEEEPTPVPQLEDIEYEEGHKEEKDDEERDEDADDVDVSVETEPVVPMSSSSFDEETQALVNIAEKARAEFDAVHKEVKDLEERIESLKKALEKDYGPEDEYAAFADRCVELTDLEYTYKLCLFDHCSQKPKAGGSETRLGNWEKWDGGDMLFTGGQQCWNGPSRSTRVHIRCAVEPRLISVSEPSKCEYEMQLEIPSACKNPQEKQQGHDEL